MIVSAHSKVSSGQKRRPLKAPARRPPRIKPEPLPSSIPVPPSSSVPDPPADGGSQQQPHQQQRLSHLSSQFAAAQQARKAAAAAKKIKNTNAAARMLELAKKRCILNQRLYLQGPGLCNLALTSLTASGTHKFVPFLWTKTYESFEVFRQKRRVNRTGDSGSGESNTTPGDYRLDYVKVKKKRCTMYKKIYAFVQILSIGNYTTTRREENPKSRKEYEVVIRYGAVKHECNPAAGKCSKTRNREPGRVHYPDEKGHKLTAMQRFETKSITAKIIVGESHVCDKTNAASSTTDQALSFFSGLSKKDFDRRLIGCFYKKRMYRD